MTPTPEKCESYIKALLAPNNRSTVRTNLQEIIEKIGKGDDGNAVLETIKLLNRAEVEQGNKELAGWYAEKLAKKAKRARNWAIGATTAAAILLAAATAAYALVGRDKHDEKPAETEKYERRYLNTETVFVDALVDKTWYAEDEVPEGKTPTEYRITTRPEQGLFIKVEKESVEMLKQTLRRAEINDAKKNRLDDYRLHHTPREIDDLLYGIANKSDDKDSGIGITKEDCENALKIVNRGGGLGELTLNEYSHFILIPRAPETPK